MDSRWEEYTIGPAAVGLDDLEWTTLRCLMEGNGTEFFPAGWEEAIPLLLERELVEATHHGPTLNSREGPRGTQSHQGTAPEPPGRPAYHVTLQGHTVLAQVGTFRRAVTTATVPAFGAAVAEAWAGWRKPVVIATAVGVAMGIVAAIVLAFFA